MDGKKLNPIVDKVLKLQIHRVPIISLADILGLSVAEVDKIMRENGYVFENEIYKIPTPVEPKKSTTVIKTVKKKKMTKQQKKDAEIEANPTRRITRKYGVYNFETHLYHLNTEVVKIMLMQDEEKLPLEKIAENMNMTVKVMTNFMRKHNYILEEAPITRKTKKPQKPKLVFVKTKPEVDEKINPEDEIAITEIPVTRIDNSNEILTSELGLTKEDIICAKKFYNWYLTLKDLPSFRELN